MFHLVENYHILMLSCISDGLFKCYLFYDMYQYGYHKINYGHLYINANQHAVLCFIKIFHVGTIKSDYSQYAKKEIKALPYPACIYMNIYFSVQFYIFQSILWLYVNRIMNKKLFALVGSVSAQ